MELDKLLDIYFEKFGENYPLSIVDDRDDEEIANEIRECILNNTPAKEPESDENVTI